jgi:hypothetical protein
MVAGEDQQRPSVTSPHRRATFELERFTWAAPDRLEVSGRFVGLGDAPEDAPAVVVRGADRTHRLPAVPGSVSGSPEDGTLWSAEFAWQEPPVAFDVARLELGRDIVVELPQPGTQRRRFRKQILEVSGPGRGAELLRLEAELVAAHEEIRELRAAAEQAQEELTRAREDLKAERDRHAADAERFREGLARVQASAEQALAVEQRAARQLGSELHQALDAVEARDAALADLREQLEAATAARTQAQHQARTQLEAVQERLAARENARSAAEEARTDAEHLLGRLTTICEALREGR